MTVERFDHPAQLPAMLTPQVDAWIARLEPSIKLTELTYNSSMIPAAMKGKREDVLAAFIRSGDLGVPPFVGIAHMHVISGKVGISAELMRALILRAGHELQVTESTADRCVIRGRRTGWSDWTTASFSMQEAQKAGYARKNANYQSAPADMLLARATTRLARMVFADVVAGLRSVEELQDMVDVYDDGPAPQIEQTVTKVSRQGASPAPAVEEEPQAAPGGAAPMAMGGVPAAGEAASEQRPAASPARKRAPLTPRGRATQPVPEPVPDPVDEETGEVVEAEVVEEHSNVSPLAGARAELRQKAVVNVQLQFERLLGKPVDREERLWWSGIIVGHPVESTNDLDAEELRKVQARLERFRDREALELALGKSGGE